MKRRNTIALSVCVGVGIIEIFIIKLQQNCIRKWIEQTKKNRSLFILMNQWVSIKQEDKDLNSYFKKFHYKNIAIYGMGYVGQGLVKELKNCETIVSYGIDQNAKNIYSEIELLTLEDNLPRVDAVVVTALNEFNNISTILNERLKCPIVSIADILNEV